MIMRELPQHLVLEGFYMWLNMQEKEQYYSTPLYLYSTLRKEYEDETRLYLELEKDISKIKPSKKENVLKHPSTIYIHYAESIGMLLLRLLNADFSSFEAAYNTFFFAYGFELIKEYAPYVELKSKYSSEIEFVNMIENIYKDSLDKLLEIQDNFRKCVDFIYNLNGNEELKNYKANSKFIAYTIQNDIYTYSQDIEIILDNYVKKHHEYHNEDIKSLVEKIDGNDAKLELNNVYTSSKLSSICFVILEQLVKQDNLPIKTCQNCGRYFIPTFRQNEIYCDFINIDGKPTCREKGAAETYKKNLENVPALLEYRRSYQQKIMAVYRNKENKQIKKEFDKWKEEAQSKIKLFKQGKLDEETLYKWIMENK